MLDPVEQLASLLEAERRGEKPYLLFFWSHKAQRPGPGPWLLSQWWRAPFDIGGVCYATAEGYMMAAKARLFGDDETLRRIQETEDPAEAKALGRVVRGFAPRAWEAAAYQIVIDANLAKFSQHPDLGAFLIGTTPATLVEASPQDQVWGIGLDAGSPDARVPSRWRGRNLLGFALMDVRERLIRGAGASSAH